MMDMQLEWRFVMPSLYRRPEIIINHLFGRPRASLWERRIRQSRLIKGLSALPRPTRVVITGNG